MQRQVGTWVTDFLRYHVLIRVFHGDVEAWIALTMNVQDQSDLDFLRWLKERLDADASLLPRIRSAVDSSGLWPERNVTSGSETSAP